MEWVRRCMERSGGVGRAERQGGAATGKIGESRKVEMEQMLQEVENIGGSKVYKREREEKSRG